MYPSISRWGSKLAAANMSSKRCTAFVYYKFPSLKTTHKHQQSRRLCTTEKIEQVETKTLSERIEDAKIYVPTGVTILMIGITVLTLNERRDVQQAALTERARHVCESYDSNTDKMPHAALNGHLLHTSGKVDAVVPFPVDDDLNVSQPKSLRLKRVTAMYQWIEKEHSSTTKNKNKDGTETETKKTWYTYSKDWRESKETINHSSDKCNPPFPDKLKSKTFEAGGGLTLGKAKFQLCDTMVKDLTEFVPMLLNKETAGKNKDLFGTRDHNLVVRNDGKMMYTKGGNPAFPAVGDVRVTYESVLPGDYTTVGKLDGETLAVYAEAMRPKLAAQGDIEIVPEAQELAVMIGYKTFVVPEKVIIYVEDYLHKIAPIQVCMITPGIKSKSESFDVIKARDEASSDGIRYLGTAIVVLGSWMAMSVVQAASSRNMTLTALATGLSISYATMTRAREQIHAPPLPKDNAIGVIGEWSQSMKSAAVAAEKDPHNQESNKAVMNSETGGQSFGFFGSKPVAKKADAVPPPPPPPPPPPAEQEWRAVIGKDGQTYYWNTKTNATAWNRPQ